MPAGKWPGYNDCGYTYLTDKINVDVCKQWCDTNSANYCVYYESLDWCAYWVFPCDFLSDTLGESRVTFKKYDCSTSLVDASFPNPQPIPYNSGGSPVIVTAEFNVIFSGYDNTNTDCVLNSCSLRKPDYTTPLAA